MKKEHIRSKIVSLVPDIMELKFGARLYQPLHKKTLLYIGKDNGQYALKMDDSDVLLLVDSIGDCEVLGRPIQLADILRAIDRGVLVDRNGIFCDLNLRPLNIGNAWNLTKDLDGQTDEVWEFIGKILGV